jgi:ferredoxin
MKIILEEDKCVGAGQCVLSAPLVFDQHDDGIAFILDDAPIEADRANVEVAVRLCPARALALAETVDA